ncbi:MAG: hypothetical protein N2644_02835 [Candidatus Sumerlaea chitinivorans]|nr:hypothetical protein [Candidatus Sumerlaea chitinivorans]
MIEVTNSMSQDTKHPEGETSLEASPEKPNLSAAAETQAAVKAAPGELKDTAKVSESSGATSPAKSAAAAKPASAAAQPSKKEIPPAPDTTTRFGARLEDPELQLSRFHVTHVLRRVVLVGLVTLALVVGAELFIRSVLVPASVIHRAVNQQTR